jgi:F-type H+-transporting ATPase subunit b
MTIDWWTLGLQTVNVAVLVWLLGRFFWRPMADMIEQRRVAAQRTLADAQAKRDEAAAALADIENTRAGFDRERQAILAAARESAEQARAAILAGAAKEAAVLERAATAALAQEREAAAKAWTERASRLAVEIAQRLAARLNGPAVREAFLDWLLKELQKLPAPARRAMTADDVTLKAASATPLEPADQERYRARIGEALGAQPRIAFNTDPALIAGLELRGPHLVVSNSWRADLTEILADITHDQRP